MKKLLEFIEWLFITTLVLTLVFMPFIVLLHFIIKYW